MSIDTSRAQRRQLERANANMGNALAEIPLLKWPQLNQSGGDQRTRVWRSRHYIVQEFIVKEPDVVCRLSVNRTQLTGNRWTDGLAWEELQQIKNEIGYFAHAAVEIYPPVLDEVNVANLRHLWVLAKTPQFMWRARRIGE